MIPFIFDTIKSLLNDNYFMFFSGLLFGYLLTRWFLLHYFFKNSDHIIICKKSTRPNRPNLYVNQVPVFINYSYKIVEIQCTEFDILTKNCLKTNKPCPFYGAKYKV